jgi:sulfur carrier protein
VTIEVSVNAVPRGVPAGTTLGQVVTELVGPAAGVAAAVNGEVVPRRSWGERVLADGDRVDVVTAVQGG